MNTATPSFGALLVDPQSPAFVQVAALCLRRTAAATEVLLVQTLRLRQWVIPKGWPVTGKSLAESAACEAWEEAGIVGTVRPDLLGCFSYTKVKKSGLPIRCKAHVFQIDVDSVADDFPEANKRVRLWQTPDIAAEMVRDPELGQILRTL
jgi:8-oxo-dGTP pyrophosphatase MutT (NUDIX family)